MAVAAGSAAGGRGGGGRRFNARPTKKVVTAAGRLTAQGQTASVDRKASRSILMWL